MILPDASPVRNFLSIDLIKEHVIQVAREYEAAKVFLFGSCARGDMNSDSDVDILLEKGSIKGMQLLDFQGELERRLGCKVDVVTTAGASERFLKRINNEKILLYSNES
ncbi:nucleotidyltransferase family protein [Anaerotardibacter muris]|uniref:nucleotidyltransferase family protein n=1 Tax=Anaerotardibacter muris TaxID=2941505 RepID=UPI00203B8C46|nr:nucleotidyltransferase domain-containing protein [Anaerotardibacter muris]